MKTWTQSEYDAETRTSHGVILGTGDFRRIDFRGRHHVVIGQQSIIGKDAHLGESCQIGDYCEIGSGLVLGAFSKIGEHCHIGENAMIGESCRIGRGTCFATGVGIGPGTEMGDGVQLPRSCKYLFDYRAKNADGRTLVTCVPTYGMPVHAFVADRSENVRSVYVMSKGSLRTLDEFEEFAVDAACCCGMTGMMSDIEDGQRMLATAKYIRALFSAAGMCASRRSAG